jgi:hypothetical protein
MERNEDDETSAAVRSASPSETESTSWSPFACRKDSIPTDRIFWDQVSQFLLPILTHLLSGILCNRSVTG